eukprot:TRINITY_DN124_c2_g1_i1.p6 TRINITY_DN124_c2_g1~~TRINITY_DN124_c2_g1_i1.p6  ORF type:complete len:195 (+),score=25.18 TRINITY_DN124_c2_g1_i1:3312-3896(+)
MPVFLFFSVNGSGQFIGVAKMVSPVNFSEKLAHWDLKGKWMGKFRVEWIFIKDIKNKEFRTITVPSENKPVTNLRDAQEVPFEQGMKMLRIFKEHKYESSLLDEFEYYDEEEMLRKEETKAKGKGPPAGRGKKFGRGRGKGAAMERIIPVEESEHGVKAVIPVSTNLEMSKSASEQLQSTAFTTPKVDQIFLLS